MKVPLALYICLGLCLVFNTGLLHAQTEGETDWDYEIDLLGRELAEKHPDLFFRTDSTFFFRALKEVAGEAPGKSQFHIAVKLQQIVAKMGDSHTMVNYHFYVDQSLILPFESYWFSDGIYITRTDREYEAMLGKRLTAINGIPLAVVIDSLSTLLVHDNPSVLKYQVPRMLGWSQLLSHFGFSDMETLNFQVADEKGNKEVVSLNLPVSLGETVKVQGETLPLGWQDPKAYFREQYLEDDKIYYIQYNRCWSREVEEEHGSGATALFMPSFKEFEKKVLQVLRKKEVDKLIFDLRFNSGGHAGQGTRFTEDLHKANRRGQVQYYLLVGRKTRAEALINAFDYMRGEGVVVVGEESGGRPNHFGEVRRFVLPESGLIVSHSTKYIRLQEGDSGSLVPDVEACISMQQYLEGVDPAVDAVRKHP